MASFFPEAKGKCKFEQRNCNPFLALFAAPVFGFAYPARLWLIFNGSTQHLQRLRPFDHLYSLTWARPPWRGMSVASPAQLLRLPRTNVSWARRPLYMKGAATSHIWQLLHMIPHRQFTATIMKDVSFLPSNVYMWRCKSAWDSHLLMRRCLSLLASSLGSVLKERRLHPTILAHAKQCRTRLCFIPALMTAELQPCDTHLFARFKATFREHWRRRKALSIAGSLSTLQWLEVVVSTIQAVLPTDWDAAFAGSGRADPYC